MSKISTTTDIDINTWVLPCMDTSSFHWCLGRLHITHFARRHTNVSRLRFRTLTSTYRSVYSPLRYQLNHHRRMLFIYMHMNASLHVNFWHHIPAHRSNSFIPRSTSTFMASRIHVYQPGLLPPLISMQVVWNGLAQALALSGVTQASRDPQFR